MSALVLRRGILLSDPHPKAHTLATDSSLSHETLLPQTLIICAGLISTLACSRLPGLKARLRLKGESGLLCTPLDSTHSCSREYFCSYPTRSCTAFIKSDRPLSDTLSYSFVPLRLLKDTSTSCVDSSTIKYRGQSIDPGMSFEFLAKVQTVPRNMVQCEMILADGKEAAVLTVKHATESWITWVGDTNYNIDAGGPEHDFSFKGPDPHSSLTRILSMVKSLSYDELRQLHLYDYEEGLTSKFSLDLGASPNFAKSTKEQMEDYTREKGNAHLDLLLFNYGRYLLFSSGRGALPANLQGVWAKDERPPWSAGKLYRAAG